LVLLQNEAQNDTHNNLVLIEIQPHLLGSIYPTSQVVYVGSTVILICYSIAAPKWSRKNKILQGHRIISNYIILDDVKERDHGHYICEGTLTILGEKFVTMAELWVGGKESVVNNCLFWTSSVITVKV